MTSAPAIVFRDRVASTNDEARRLADAGAADRSVICAAEQLAGRGRHGRPWLSPRGNLYLSLVSYPDLPVAAVTQAGFAAALAIAETVRALLPGVSPDLKWPNDVLVAGAKLSGILLETHDRACDGRRVLILGLGINVTVCPDIPGRHSTSLAALGYPPPEPAPEPGMDPVARVRTVLVPRLNRWLDIWQCEGFAPLRRAWLRHAAPGGRIVVRIGAARLSGRYLGLDDDGALLLAGAGGPRRIATGEVFPDMDGCRAAGD